jgi:hypothetical protein
MARPTPPPAPVTSATCPSRRTGGMCSHRVIRTRPVGDEYFTPFGEDSVSSPTNLKALWHLARDSAHHPQYLVSGVGGRVEHARTASFDDSHAMLTPVVRR